MRFVRKSELHVTVVGSRLQLDGAALRDAARGLEFKIKPTGIYRLVRKETRCALIELVAVEGLDAYCARLAVTAPPAHVTLFTEPGGRGIALYTQDELETLSVLLKEPPVPSPWHVDEAGAILGA